MSLASDTVPARPFAAEVARTARLAAPIAVARAAILVMFVADTVMTGWAGAFELGALGLGSAVMVALMLVSIGTLQAVLVMTARALGRGEARIGSIWRAGLLVALVSGVATVLVAQLAEPFFLWTGQSAELAARAGAVAVAFGWGIPGMLLFVASNLYLEATGSPRIGMWVMIGVNVVNIGLNALLIFGWGPLPAMGAVGAIAASSTARWLAFFAVLAVLLLREVRAGDPRASLSFGGELAALPRFVALGLPMGLAQGVESTAFAAISIIAGRVSAEALAVHQALLSLIAFVYMFAIGTSGATAIRVGRAAGAGDATGARLAGWAGVVLAGLVAAVFSASFLAVPQAIVGVYGLEGRVLALGVTTLAVAAFVVPFDAMMAGTIGALRGLADVWVPLMLQAGAFWLVAVPAAWAFAPQLGAPGLMGAILAGVLASTAMLALRFRAVSRVPAQPPGKRPPRVLVRS